MFNLAKLALGTILAVLVAGTLTALQVPAEKPEAGGRLPVRGWAAFTLSGLGR